MRKYKAGDSRFLNLDSLVDIVSNNVGILIILSAFMALFALINPASSEETGETIPENAIPKKLQVPWSHPTNKQMLYFNLRENRIQHLDLRAFYLELAQREVSLRPEPLDIPQKGVDIRFFPVTNQVYCLEFKPHPRAGETWFQAQQPTAEWQNALNLYPAEKFVYFFWVTGDSFELFRQLRESLRERQIEVGWKPTLEDSPLEVCNGFEGSSTFQPQ